MTVLITLTLAGADTGPFSLYSDVDGYLAPFEVSVSKAALEAGYTSVVVPDGSTVIRVQSNSACTNYVDFPISGITTTTTSSTSTSTSTSTTTTTTSIAPIEGTQYQLFGYAENRGEACDQSGISYVSLGELTVFAASPLPSGVTLFYNYGSPTLFDPYINSGIPNGSFIVFVKSIGDPLDYYVGEYNNTTGAITNVVACLV
jgi:hypothetical protein